MVHGQKDAMLRTDTEASAALREAAGPFLESGVPASGPWKAGRFGRRLGHSLPGDLGPGSLRVLRAGGPRQSQGRDVTRPGNTRRTRSGGRETAATGDSAPYAATRRGENARESARLSAGSNPTRPPHRPAESPQASDFIRERGAGCAAPPYREASGTLLDGSQRDWRRR